MSFQKALAMVVHHQSSHVPASDLAFLASEDAFASAAAADIDVQASVAAMVDTLAGTALDPLRGTDVGHFVSDGGDHWSIHLSFHRLSHFINLFDIPKASPGAAELVTAIEANLQSKMFKAALIDRRLQRRFVKLQTRCSSRHIETYRAYVTANSRQGMAQLEHQKVISQAEEAAARATEPRRASLLQRQRFLSARAMPTLAGRSYSQWVAERLASVLPRFVPAAA